MCSLINKQLLLTAYAYLFIMEQQEGQQGSDAMQIKKEEEEFNQKFARLEDTAEALKQQIRQQTRNNKKAGVIFLGAKAAQEEREAGIAWTKIKEARMEKVEVLLARFIKKDMAMEAWLKEARELQETIPGHEPLRNAIRSAQGIIVDALLKRLSKAVGGLYKRLHQDAVELRQTLQDDLDKKLQELQVSMSKRPINKGESAKKLEESDHLKALIQRLANGIDYLETATKVE